jgi:tetratricopeptide (TPR) repeat protein
VSSSPATTMTTTTTPKKETTVQEEPAGNETTTVIQTSINMEDPPILFTDIAAYRDDYLTRNLNLLQPYFNLESAGGGVEAGNMLLDNSEAIEDGPKLHYVTTFLATKADIAAQADIGIALFRDGKCEEAIDIFDSILENDDKHIESLYHKARCLEQLGYLDQANQTMNRVHEIDPNYKEEFIKVVSTSPVAQAIAAPLQQAIAAPLQQLFSPITGSSSASSK